MRKVVVGIVAVLMMAGMAWGAPSFSITSGGLSSISPAGNAVVPITISLVGVDQPLFGWGFTLSAPAGWQLAKFTNTTDTYGVGSAIGYDPGSAYTWSAAANIPFPLPPTGADMGTLAADLGAGTSLSGPVLTVNLIAPANVTAGQIAAVSGTAVVVDAEFSSVESAVSPLEVPEPISALLLLAGLPMLRRRR